MELVPERYTCGELLSCEKVGRILDYGQFQDLFTQKF